MAKSAVNPIFSPLPHPTFFAPRSPFFPLFPVFSPFSGDFSRDRARFSPFYRLFSFPFSHFESKFRRFFDVTSLFSAPNFNFSSLRPILPHTSGTSSRDLTLYYRHTSLFTQCEGFSDSRFPFFILYPTFLFPLISFPPFIPPSLFTTPPLSFSFLPTFPSPSPINARTRAPSRNTRVRVRPHLLARQEVFVYCLHRFTTPRNPLCTNTLGVKKNEKKPSQNAQQPHNQEINTKHPISSAVNLISSPR